MVHINSPIPQDVASECRKCADIVDHFVKGEKSKGIDQFIPPHILAEAKGVAIITIVKAGFIFSGRGGAGLVVARLPDGSWSAPSAIGTAGMGVGGQIGAEITDFVIILNTDAAVKAFSMGGNVTLGGNLSVAAGPYGRNAEASGAVGQLAAVYSYSKTKGLFAGISIEGSVIVERKETNAAFYGQRYSAREILSGSVPKPAAASVLYRALDRRIAAASTLSRPAGSPTDQTGRSSFSAPPPYSAGSTASGSSYMPPSPPSNTGGSIGNVLNKPAATAVSAGTTSTGLRKPPPPPRPTTTAVALFDFVGEQPTDLSFRAGDIITVTKRTDTAEGWWTGECNGRKGDFPGNYVELRQ